MSVTVTLPHREIHLLGRADVRSDALAFDWTCSGVFFRFCGNTVTFHFDAPANNQVLFVQVRMDGRWSRHRLAADSTAVTVQASEDGEHRVSCVRINEVLDGVPIVLRRLTLDGDAPALLPKPAMPDRRMIFIGDSITCGYGLLTKGLGDGFKTDEQDGAHTAAALTADHFGAEAHFICISGRGIVRNCDNFPAPHIPDFFDLTTVSAPTPWDHAQFQPHVVVINAATNDTVGETDPVDYAVFAKGAAAFLRHLREVFPQAKLLWAYGMMNEELDETLAQTIAAMNDDAIGYLKFRNAWSMDGELGASNHPNARSHRRCAGVLIDKVSEMVGWER